MTATEPPPTSAGLLHRLAAPDAQVDWAVFVGRYSPLVLARCRQAGLQPADADDVRAAVFARLVKALRAFRYDPARRFRGYLSRVTDSAVRTHWRHLAARPGAVGRGGSDALPEPLARLPGELDEGIRGQLAGAAGAIERVKRDVGPGAWAAFWLTAVDGLTGAEAAERTGTTPAAVYVAKGRVLKQLRAAAGFALPPGGPTEETTGDRPPDPV